MCVYCDLVIKVNRINGTRAVNYFVKFLQRTVVTKTTEMNHFHDAVVEQERGGNATVLFHCEAGRNSRDPIQQVPVPW